MEQQGHRNSIDSPDPEGVAERDVQPTQGETINGRRRMRWTNEMNEYLYRTYLVITKMETTNEPYSNELYERMIEKFPVLRRKTRQNILDQRRQLFTHDRINVNRIDEIRREVEIELEMRPPDQQQELGGIVNQTEEVDIETNRMIHCFEKNLILFRGMDPLSRPKLSHLRTNKKTTDILKRINRIMIDKLEEISNLQDYNNFVYAGACTVIELHEQRTFRKEIGVNIRKPAWEIRIERKIDDLRKSIGQLSQYIQTDMPTNKLCNKIRQIIERHSDQENRTTVQILDKLKQKLSVYSNRLKRYRESYLRKTQNHLFCTSQRQFYRNISRTYSEDNKLPEIGETRTYWANIWENPETHNPTAKWLKDEMKNADKVPIMMYNTITEADVRTAINNTSNWKAPGPDGIHNYWLKKFYVTHNALANLLTSCIRNPEQIPAFITMGTTYLLPKSCPSVRDPAKYRPITCLPTLYKVLTSVLCTQIYQHLERNKLLPEEQKGCRKGSRGCKEQLVIDTIISEEAKQRKRDLYVAYIDYKKAFDSVPHTLLIEMLKIYKINPSLISLLQHLMPQWKTCLYLQSGQGQTNIGDIDIKRGIFQGDALSALWYCITLAPLSKMLNKRKVGYTLNNGQQIDHLAYMDDIKLISASKQGLNELLKTIQKYSEDTRMEFGLDKCKISAMRKGVWENHPGFYLQPDKMIKAMEREDTYQYLGLDQARGMKHKEMKEMLKKRLMNRVKMILKTQLSGRNKVTAINTYAIPTIAYSFGIIKWSDTDIQEVNRAVRVLFTKYRARHPKSSVERFYLPRSKGGRGIIDLKEAQQQQVDSLRKFFHEKSEISSYHRNIVRADRNFTPLKLADREYKPLQEIIPIQLKIQRWKAKELHGRYPAILDNDQIDAVASSAWLENGDLFAETEGFIMGIQDQVIPTLNYRKFIMQDQTVINDKCRLCNNKPETIGHIISGCTTLAPTEYMKRHDNVARVIHQELCKNANLLTEHQPYYNYKPDPVMENETHKIYWDRTIQTDHTLEHNRPDIMLQDKTNKITYLIDIAVPAAHNIPDTQVEKIRKYIPLAAEIKQIWNQDKVVVIPIVVGATGEIPNKLHENLEKLYLPPKLYLQLQKLAILGTCHIARKALNVGT